MSARLKELNEEFGKWVAEQARTNSKKSWAKAMEQYIDYAKEISKEDSVGGDKQVPLSALFAPKADEWSCPTCMTKNKGSALKCPCCETDKPGASTAAASSSSQPSLAAMFAPKADEWSCPTCMTKNKASSVKCPCCDTDQPGAAAATSNPFPATSGNPFAASSGNPFAAANPFATPNPFAAAAPAPAVGDSSLSALFAPKTDEWACPTCMVKNKSSVLQCPCCNTDKP